LVRISEQRRYVPHENYLIIFILNFINSITVLIFSSVFRQENLSMNLKLNAVERRSRELLLTQGAAMSGAAVALSGLSTRLEGLVDQLIASYNISIKDLEASINSLSLLSFINLLKNFIQMNSNNILYFL